MKKLTKFRFGHVAMFIMAATLSFTACTKDEIEDDSTKDGEEAIPEFVSYTPEYAEIGVETDAMIMGKNFGTDASRITVMLGETEMTVTEAGRSVIKFTVPETMEAGQYPLSVTVVYTDSEGVEQKASHTFEVDFEIRARVPEITGYKPAAGIYPGGELTIEGTDLGSDPALVTVTLGGEALEVKSVAPGAIVVTVPEDTAFGTYELKVDVKYGTGGSQTATKTFSDFNVLKKEYVVTSEVWAGAGPQGADNGARLSAKFFAPQSLAFDDKTGALYVGEVYNGIRFINSSGNVSYYKAPQDNNPWWDGGRITCLVSVEGDRLAYVVRNARERSWKYLWTASRTGGDFPEAAGAVDFNNDLEYEDVAVNPVDGYMVATASQWFFWRTESRFFLVSPDGSTVTEPDFSITDTNSDKSVWNSHYSRVVFSPDGKWLYVARASNDINPSADDGFKPVAYIERYPYDPATHTLGNADSRELVAGDIVTGASVGSQTGLTDGPVGTSRLAGPKQMCFDSTGEILYFVESINHALRKITDLDGTPTVTTVAGNGSKGSNDVTSAPEADMKNITFDTPKGLALGDDNTFYVSQDGDTKVIRKISISLKEAE